VLVTSRRAAWNPVLGVEALPLDVLPRAESMLLLRKHRPDVVHDAQLQAIAEEVGDLPLALHVAGRYLARYRYAVTPSAYVEQLRRFKVQGLSRQVGDASPTLHVQRIDRTFALSFDRLDPASLIDAFALALVARAAYFTPGEPIPRDLLLATVQRSDGDVLHIEDALGRLLDLSLVEPATNGALRMHRLVLTSLGALMRDEGEHSAAQPYLEQAITIWDQEYGIEYPELVQPLNDLGLLFLQQGDVAQAQVQFERALAICHKKLGEVHPDTAMTLNNLGQVHQAQVNILGARECYEHALPICQQRLAPDHPLTRGVKANLDALSN
jgi:tetratricopeptide (TPR) repeat protein